MTSVFDHISFDAKSTRAEVHSIRAEPIRNVTYPETRPDPNLTQPKFKPNDSFARSTHKTY